MSNETTVDDIISLSIKGDGGGVKSAINDTLHQKVMVSLEGKKKDFASTFLNKTETDSKEPESSEVEDGSRDASTT